MYTRSEVVAMEWLVTHGCAGNYYDSNQSYGCENKLAKVDEDLEDLNIYDILEPCYHLGETDRPLAVRKQIFGHAWPYRAPIREGYVWPQLLSAYEVPCNCAIQQLLLQIDTYVRLIWDVKIVYLSSKSLIPYKLPYVLHSLANSCFPVNQGASASRLHELFLRQTCDAHTCSRGHKPFCRGGKKHTSIFYFAISISTLMLLPIFDLIVFLYQENRGGTQELRRISQLGRRTKAS